MAISDEQKVKILDELERVYTDYRNNMGQLMELMGAEYESPLVESVFRLEWLVIKKIAKEIGTEYDMLFDWAFIHLFGDNPMVIYIDNVKKVCKDNVSLVEVLNLINSKEI